MLHNQMCGIACTIAQQHVAHTQTKCALLHTKFFFLQNVHKLAHVQMSFSDADLFVKELLKPYHTGKLDIVDTRAYKRVIELWQGRTIGADILRAAHVDGSRWGMLNAVTQLVDHERGRSDNTRLESAWFGTGSAIKNRALELLTA